MTDAGREFRDDGAVLLKARLLNEAGAVLGKNIWGAWPAPHHLGGNNG